MNILCTSCYGIGELVVTYYGKRIATTRCPRCNGTGRTLPLDDMPDNIIMEVAKSRIQNKRNRDSAYWLEDIRNAVNTITRIVRKLENSAEEK